MQVTLIFISAIAFIFYGLMCLSTDHMKTEFQRYGMSRFRRLTGLLELLGGLGLLVGHFVYYPILAFSAGGLALLMFLGTIVRFKTKDPVIQILPAIILMLVNLKILFF
jgi:hypothetical protein